MKSDELNLKIAEICDDTSIGFEAFGGKAVPYIGWFWRHVDFDDGECHELGILPGIEDPFDSNDKPRVGFMVNNKWGYEYVPAVKGKRWEAIRAALVKAVTTRDAADLGAANSLIQALMPSTAKLRESQKKEAGI